MLITEENLFKQVGVIISFSKIIKNNKDRNLRYATHILAQKTNEILKLHILMYT